jgi:phage recombination protein Bet
MTKQTTAAAEKSVASLQAGRPSLMATFAGKFGVDADKMATTLKATAFRTGAKDPEVTNEQLMALVVVSNQFNLNPFLKEIYAFPDQKGGIIPVVGIDGWLRLINEHPQYKSMEIRYAEHGQGEIPEWCEVEIERKDRAKPTIVREYFSEVKRNTGPWGSHPRRMLRHKTIIQCGRVAFAFTGIHDPDEAERIRDAIDVTPPNAKPKTAAPQARTEERPAIAGEAHEVAQGSLADATREPTDAELEEAGARG